MSVEIRKGNEEGVFGLFFILMGFVIYTANYHNVLF